MRRHHRWAIVAAVATAVVAAPVTNHFVNPPPVPVASNASCHIIDAQLPDKTCTPGVADPRVTQANIQQTICVKGYTATVRPPVSYTNQVKLQSYADYGISPSVKAELDHLIPLELGGAPADPKNLWVEPGSIPNPKDSVENRLHAEVCAGTVTLQAAQQAISTNWTTAP
jgi:hypothetical protein